jgi:hypothetical protein
VVPGRGDREPVDLRRGDVFVVESNDFLARMICRAERAKDVCADARYNHAGIIYAAPEYVFPPGGAMTFEALWRVRVGQLNDYAGRHILIARYVDSTCSDIEAGFRHVLKREGERYPVLRLLLHLANAARLVHFNKVVCSELVAEFIYHATGLAEFKDEYGYDPAQLADIFERWRQFEIVYKGIWK